MCNFSKNWLNIWFALGFILIGCSLLFGRNRPQLICTLSGISLSMCACLALYFEAILAIPYCFGIFGLFGGLTITCFGISDAYFTAKKLIYYNIVAILMFFLIASFQNQGMRFICVAITFGIASASYPLSGWIEHFYLHAPSAILNAFNVFFRPMAIFFMVKLLQTVICAENYECIHKTCLTLGALGTLFIPVLFFSKTENRRLLAYVACWQNGILWILLANCDATHYEFAMYLPVIQGIPMAVLTLNVLFLHKKFSNDEIKNISEIWASNRFCTMCMVISFTILGILPLIVAFVAKLSFPSTAMCITSSALFFVFAFNAFFQKRISL